MGQMANDEPTPDVLSSLPRTRPQRRSAKRDAPKPKPKPTATAKPRPKPKTQPKKKAPARTIPPAGFAPPADAHTRPTPSAAEIVGTAVQAAGELAQIGLAIGGQALRSALRRSRRD
jgi:outer membrane biosynthesis protein TonB